MIFENPSNFTLNKMQELIGNKMSRSTDDGPIKKISYSKNHFDIIDGYRLYIDLGWSSKSNPDRIPVCHYPNSFKSTGTFDLEKCDLECP